MTVKLCSGADVKMVQSNAGKVFHKQALQENIRKVISISQSIEF